VIFDNGVRNCRPGPVDAPALIVLARGDSWLVEGGVLIPRISKTEPFSPDGLVVAARHRCFRLRLVQPCPKLARGCTLGMCRWMRRNRPESEAIYA
jgi:hypothetical protein